jgi:hypothetical protein
VSFPRSRQAEIGVATRRQGKAGGVSNFPPAKSALNLRALLALFGLVVCGGAAVLFFLLRDTAPGGLVLAGLLALGALIAIVDLGVIYRRKRQRQDADRRAGRPGDSSLFE